MNLERVKLAFAFACASLCVAGECSAAANQTKVDEAAFYCQSMWNCGTRLVTGMCEATATRTNAIMGTKSKRKIKFFFDVANRAARFDLQTHGRTSQFIRTKKELVLYTKPGRVVARYLPDHKIDVYNVEPRDLRGLGVVTWAEWEYRASLKNMMKFLSADRLTRIETKDGTVVLTWEHPVADGVYAGRYRVWLEPEKDFAPVRVETFARRLPSKEWVPQALTVTKWEKFHGHYVPTRCVFDEYLGKEHYELNLSWKRVNEKLPESAFTVEGLGLEDGTSVWNVRGEEPVLEYIVGEGT